MRLLRLQAIHSAVHRSRRASQRARAVCPMDRRRRTGWTRCNPTIAKRHRARGRVRWTASAVSHSETWRTSPTASVRYVTVAGPAIVVPRHSSERTRLHPDGIPRLHPLWFRTPANVIYDAQPWLFALLQSRMHNGLGGSGGRHGSKTDYQLLCKPLLQHVPIPGLSDEARRLADAACSTVLDAREQLLRSDAWRTSITRRRCRRIYDVPTSDSTRRRSVVRKGRSARIERLEMLFELYEERRRRDSPEEGTGAMPNLSTSEYERTGREYDDRHARYAGDAREGVRSA